MEADRQNQSRIKQQTKCEVLGKTNKKRKFKKEERGAINATIPRDK
jgi:hypothetical protein